MTDTQSSCERCQAQKKSSSYVGKVLFDSWIAPYGIPVYVLTDDEMQFPNKLFATMCAVLGMKHQTRTAFYPKTDRKVERYNCTTVTRLQYLAAKTQEDGNKYVYH